MGGSGVDAHATNRRNGRRGVLATIDARRLLGTRLVGQASDGLLQAALGSFVLFSPERQASAGQVAAAFALLLLPYSMLGPFTGVFLDRWSRERVLVVANLARGAVTVGIAALVAKNNDGAGLAFAVLVTLGIGRLWLAGLSAGVPGVVAREHLVTANALFPTSGTIASAIATVGGLLLMPVLGSDGAVWLVLAVAVGLVVSALIAVRIPHRALGPGPRPPGAPALTADLAAVVRGMAAGARHLSRRPRARRAMAVVMAHRVAFGAMLVLALLVVRDLHPVADSDDALADFALAAAGASAGSLSAAVSAPVLVGRLGPGRWTALTLLVAAGVAPAALASLTVPLIAVGSFTMGFAGQTVKIVGDTTLQRHIDDTFRGRVFALYDVGLNVSLVAGIALAAFTAPADGVAPALWLGLALLLIATALWALRPAGLRD